MAIVRLCGFESGASGELISLTGTASIASSGQRTGSYAFRANPTTTAIGHCKPGGLSATGKPTADSLTDGFRVGFAFKAVTLPAATEEIIAQWSGALSSVRATLTITSAGLLKLYAGTPAGTLLATGATVIGSAYVYIEALINDTTNAYQVNINGVTEFSGTNAAISGVSLDFYIGKVANTNGNTVDFYYDDLYIDDAAFQATTTAFPEVRILLPNAAGGSAGWTNGTGTTFAEADEVPPDTDGVDATVITDTATSTVYHTFRVQSTTTGGVTGTVLAVEAYVWARTSSISGTSTVAVRMRNSATNVDKTGLELTVAYQGLHNLQVVNPNGGAAWTLGGVDTVEVGMTAATIAQSQRFTAAYIFVLALVSAAVAGGLPPSRIVLQAVNRASTY